MTTGTTFDPQFAALDGQRGVLVSDPVEDVRFSVFTEDDVSPTPCATDAAPWCFPIDSAARFPATGLSLPLRVNVNVRRPDASLVASVVDKSPVSVDEAGWYTVELSSTPMKLFIAADSRVLVLPGDNSTDLLFPDAEEIHLGARTLHETPARTLTTTRDPEDVMRVVSEFGAALKTTSCERSWPTLRGHPPVVEFGDAVDLPGGRRKPETGVHIEVPPEPSSLFPVVPLAYYLAADVRPGDAPRLVTDDGWSYDLTRAGGLEQTTGEVLKHVFTMDCLTRVEGYYPVDLHERRRGESIASLDLNFADLYEAPLPEQLRRYLDVPFEDLRPLRPEWRMTADVTPEMDRATVLPYLAGDLAVVRCSSVARPGVTASGAQDTNGPAGALADFCRAGSTAPGPSADPTDPVRGPTDAGTVRSSSDGASAFGAAPDRNETVSQDDVFHIDAADSATQTYVGDGFPVGANKSSPASYERQLTLRSEAPDHISVAVVCNDGEMQDELEVGDYYGLRDRFQFDVDVQRALTKQELRRVFESDVDFVHYIGHVTAEGMQCADGYLDAGSLSNVQASAFFLNGCRSFRQGKRLVDSGAIGGIVTLENVHNSIATEIGHHVSRLLNAGWPLDGALRLVKDDALAGRHYLVVGDGSTEIVKSEDGTQAWIVLDPRVDGDYDVDLYTFPTRSYGMGTLYNTWLTDASTRYISSGKIDSFTVTEDDLKEFFSLGAIPVQLASERTGSTISLRWSDSLSLEEL